MISIEGQSRQEENNFVLGFWKTAGANIDFVTQYLANTRILEMLKLFFFCAKYTYL